MTNGVAAHQNTPSIAFLGSEGMAETISVSVQLPFLIANHKIKVAEVPCSNGGDGRSLRTYCLAKLRGNDRFLQQTGTLQRSTPVSELPIRGRPILFRKCCGLPPCC